MDKTPDQRIERVRIFGKSSVGIQGVIALARLKNAKKITPVLQAKVSSKRPSTST